MYYICILYDIHIFLSTLCITITYIRVLYLQIYIPVCLYSMSIYLYLYTHISIYIDLYLYLYLYQYVMVYTYKHLCVYVCIRAYTRTRLFTIVFASPIVLIFEVQGLLGLLELRACRFVFVCLECLGLWDGRVEGGDCRALGDVFQVRTVILAFRIWGLGLLIWVDASC